MQERTWPPQGLMSSEDPTEMSSVALLGPLIHSLLCLSGQSSLEDRSA